MTFFLPPPAELRRHERFERLVRLRLEMLQPYRSTWALALSLMVRTGPHTYANTCFCLDLQPQSAHLLTIAAGPAQQPGKFPPASSCPYG